MTNIFDRIRLENTPTTIMIMSFRMKQRELMRQALGNVRISNHDFVVGDNSDELVCSICSFRIYFVANGTRGPGPIHWRELRNIVRISCESIIVNNVHDS